MSDKYINLDVIFKKLNDAGLVNKDKNGFYGRFSIKNHSKYLTSQELNLWLGCLHMGTNHGEECSDLHDWRFSTLGENNG